MLAATKRFEIWLKGLFATGISGASGGIPTGIAAVGIDPQHFNLQAGIGSTIRIGLAAAVIDSGIGVAAYLQKVAGLLVQAYRKTTKQISTAGAPARRFSLTARPISYIMLTSK